MSMKQRGIAVAWGTGVTAVTGIATLLPGKTNVKVDGELKRLKDGNGAIKGYVSPEDIKTLSLSVTPYAGTIANAYSGAALPTRLAVITVTDTTDSDIAGDWLCLNANREQGPDGEQVINMELEQPADTNAIKVIS